MIITFFQLPENLNVLEVHGRDLVECSKLVLKVDHPSSMHHALGYLPFAVSLAPQELQFPTE